jgi:hypothetical protein
MDEGDRLAIVATMPGEELRVMAFTIVGDRITEIDVYAGWGAPAESSR